MVASAGEPVRTIQDVFLTVILFRTRVQVMAVPKRPGQKRCGAGMKKSTTVPGACSANSKSRARKVQNGGALQSHNRKALLGGL